MPSPPRSPEATRPRTFPLGKEKAGKDRTDASSLRGTPARIGTRPSPLMESALELPWSGKSRVEIDQPSASGSHEKKPSVAKFPNWAPDNEELACYLHPSDVETGLFTGWILTKPWLPDTDYRCTTTTLSLEEGNKLIRMGYWVSKNKDLYYVHTKSK